jgi:hypothetical protein
LSLLLPLSPEVWAREKSVEEINTPRCDIAGHRYSDLSVMTAV